jgi:hypothetical protein
VEGGWGLRVARDVLFSEDNRDDNRDLLWDSISVTPLM